MQRVYLAGGMREEWRDRTKLECSDLQRLEFISPVGKEVVRHMEVSEYGNWDLHYIRQVDIVFAYMERTNPSGIGLACELGYARGIGKTVILVLEDNNEHFPKGKLDFLKVVSDVAYDNLQDGISYLRAFFIT